MMAGESKIPGNNGGQLLCSPSNSYRKILDRLTFRILSNINDKALQSKYVEHFQVMGLMVAMLVVFFMCDELGLVLWGVVHILRNGCGHQDQNQVALFQGSEMSAWQHSQNLILGIQCCRVSILIVYQWSNTHNNRV